MLGLENSAAPPLCITARWNRPLALGDCSSEKLWVAPADVPHSVTLPASPPKAAMFFCTQPSAASWSMTAKLPRLPSLLAARNALLAR
jgi:hypothetical protein